MGFSRRNRRVALYRYRDAGQDGFTRGAYDRVGLYWGSTISMRSSEGSTATKAEHTDTIQVGLDGAVPVDRNMLAIVDGVPYYVRGVNLRRRTAGPSMQQVTMESVTDDTILRDTVAPLLANGSWMADGSVVPSGSEPLVT